MRQGVSPTLLLAAAAAGFGAAMVLTQPWRLRPAPRRRRVLPTEPEMLDRWEDEGGLVTGRAVPHPDEAPPEHSLTPPGPARPLA